MTIIIIIIINKNEIINGNSENNENFNTNK